MSVFVWQPGDTGFVGTRTKVNKTAGIAIGLVVLAFLFIIVSFSTPAWLETNGELEQPKFIRIGKEINHCKYFIQLTHQFNS
jgi:hypothetical protein